MTYGGRPHGARTPCSMPVPRGRVRNHAVRAGQLPQRVATLMPGRSGRASTIAASRGDSGLTSPPQHLDRSGGVPAGRRASPRPDGASEDDSCRQGSHHATSMPNASCGSDRDRRTGLRTSQDGARKDSPRAHIAGGIVVPALGLPRTARAHRTRGDPALSRASPASRGDSQSAGGRLFFRSSANITRMPLGPRR